MWFHYGIKQALYGFTRRPSETILYIKTRVEYKFIVVSIYMDEIIYTGNSLELMNEFKEDTRMRYKMTDLGLLYHFWGMGILQSEYHKPAENMH